MLYDGCLSEGEPQCLNAAMLFNERLHAACLSRRPIDHLPVRVLDTSAYEAVRHNAHGDRQEVGRTQMHQQRGGRRLVASKFADGVRVAVRHDRPEPEDKIAHRAVEIALIGALANACAMSSDRQHPAEADIGNTREVRP